ncbi:MAG: aspartyl/asparaginyl beta-hydroxylase domain-containing protein [Pseudomonadota bacterium]|nr:aspartyl/asparaginyl beta-hydroxylase domain-containing protein [Pseudomonadota bacterium]
MHDEETRRAYPFLALMEEEVDAIRAEALAIDAALWKPMQGYQTGCNGYILDSGRFSHEYTGTDYDANRARCPAATALVARIAGVELAGFLRVEPGGVMLPHTDPRDDHLVRAHLGLQLTDEEQAWWRPGTVRLMDTRLSHWARNLGDFPRVTMVVDVRMPFVVPDGAWGPWRPDDPAVMRPAGGTNVQLS